MTAPLELRRGGDGPMPIAQAIFDPEAGCIAEQESPQQHVVFVGLCPTIAEAGLNVGGIVLALIYRSALDNLSPHDDGRLAI